MNDQPDLDASYALLRKVFPDNEHFQDDRYLSWWYRDNPYGAGIEHDLDEAGTRIAHTAYVPNRFVDIAAPPESNPLRGALSCDSAVDPDLQRGGVFKKFQNEASVAASASGLEFGYGCANWNSLVVFQKHLGWRHVQPLPVKVLVPTPTRNMPTSFALDADGIASSLFQTVVADLDIHAAPGLHSEGNLDWYRWRCSSPTTRFSMHTSEDAAIITTRVKHGGIPVAVIVRTIARRSDTTTSLRPLIAAACKHHRAPLALYVGFNHAFAVRGITPPRKMLPSPLHMCVKSLQPHIDQDTLNFSSYELLDFDAY
ncbi:MAG: hypothetical protein WBD02_10990 [Acidimicrobiia bacterium]